MDKIGAETLGVMQKATRYNKWLFYKFFKKYLRGEILEIGAGVGTFVEFSSKCGRVTAGDINSEYLDKIKNKFKNVKVVKLNIEKHKLGEKFDSIYSLNVFEHIENDEKALRNVYQMLRKKGKFVILVPMGQWNYNEIDKGLGHYRRYNKKLLKNKLIDVGFKVEKIEYANMIGGLGWFFAGRILGKKQLSDNQVGLFDKVIAPFCLFFENFKEPPFGTSVIAVAVKK